MNHMLLKATTTAATDAGMFTAVISTATIDREKDIVEPGGMVRALQKWAQTGKNIPLAWQHSTKPSDQIGYIDPRSAKEIGGQVVVDGYIDQSTEVGAHAWRMVKMGTLGFSFGYLIPEGGASRRKGGGRHIKEVDVFEVTATPGPMNNDTRVLDFKAAAAQDDGDSDQDPADTIDSILQLMQDFIDAEDDPADVATMTDIRDRLQALDVTEDAEDDSGKALRARADAAALEFASDGASVKHLPRESETAADDDGEALFPETELQGARTGEFKAVWTAAAIDELPDSAFLYVETGGSKDSDGKTTPRSLRHFPYKDSAGKVDLPHLRNALARIPQSNLSQSIKDELTAKAQRILTDAQKSVDATGRETKSRSVDPLRAKADAVALEFASDGESLRKPPRETVAQKRQPELELIELKRRTRDEMLMALSGVEEL